MKEYFKITDTIFDITEKYPETIEYLVANGFDKLANETMRKTMGKGISLELALKSKKINANIFMERMAEIIEGNRPLASTGLVEASSKNNGEVRIEGVLPCPIRIPLLEKFEKWLDEKGSQLDYTVDYDLKAASMGLDWIKSRITSDADPTVLSDVFMSAGFDLFFDKKLMGGYRDKGIFKDITGENQLNKDFQNDNINLKDPLGHYSIIGVVPAVFTVNTAVLGNRPMPTSWEDLLAPEFENTISLPMRDLDLFNAVLLHINKFFGEEGIVKLGRGLMKSMHPAEAVKSQIKKSGEDTPIITIMPYFFTQMLDEKGPMKAVWPKEGAIISPIFLLSKGSTQEKTQPIVDFLFSQEVGEVLSSGGRFPSTHPQVENNLSPQQNFMWIGWDYINTHDVGEIIRNSEQLFLASSAGGFI